MTLAEAADATCRHRHARSSVKLLHSSLVFQASCGAVILSEAAKTRRSPTETLHCPSLETSTQTQARLNGMKKKFPMLLLPADGCAGLDHLLGL